MPISVILFIVGQTATAAWAIVTMYFEMKQIKIKISELEEENKDLKESVKSLSDMLLVVKNNTDLLLLGRIKTGNSK